VPHLIPVDQGLLASCYVTPAAPLSSAELRELYEAAYGDEPFIDVAAEPPSTADVRETNRCRVHAAVVGEKVLAFAAIDNLWKGAAGQAVQDLNLMLGLPETEGLA
jgi:N-acetyl-gamma-glutamyl-phosphate reductase